MPDKCKNCGSNDVEVQHIRSRRGDLTRTVCVKCGDHTDTFGCPCCGGDLKSDATIRAYRCNQCFAEISQADLRRQIVPTPLQRDLTAAIEVLRYAGGFDNAVEFLVNANQAIQKIHVDQAG